MSSKSFLVASAVISALLLLSFEIDAYFQLSSDKDVFSAPAFIRVIGESRNIASDMMFLQADMYYHRGVVHPEGEHCNDLFSGTSTDNKDERPSVGNTVFSFKDPLMWISNGLLIEGHSHIGPGDLEEIVPWLYLSHKLDPNNIAAYTVTAYYLADRFGKTEEALSLLKEGMRENPNSWRIAAAIGKLMRQTLKDDVSAINFLERADTLMLKSPHDRYDAREVLTLLAYSYIESGNTEKALDVLRRIRSLFPESEIIDRKISDLELKVIPIK